MPGKRLGISMGLLVGVWAFAQHLPFRTLSIEDGLAQSVVYAVEQDRTGYLWFGTQTGLSRYDGLMFRTFDHRDGMKSTLVRCVFVDPDGTLWVGTEQGVGKLSGDRFRWIEAGLKHPSVRSMTQTRSGDFWVGTYGGGAARLVDGKFIPFSKADGLPNDHVRALAALRDGRLAIGTYGGGLCLYRSGDIECVDESRGLENLMVRALLEDPSGAIWIGTNDGVFVFQDGQARRDDRCTPLRGVTINSMVLDHRQRIWFATREQGVFILSDGRMKHYSTQQGLANDSVYGLAQDHEGNLWFGTYGGGVSQLGHEDFLIFNEQQGLANPSVYAFVEDRGGELWLATNGGGLAVIKGDEIRRYTKADGLVDNTVLCAETDFNGDLWLGTLNGVSVMSGDSFTTLDLSEGFVSPIVYDISMAPDGSLWFGTYEGLVRLHEGRFESIGTGQGLPNQRVNVIEFDAQGKGYIGTAGGLAVMRDNVISTLQIPGTDRGFVNDLYVDGAGVLWVATTDGCFSIEKDAVTGQVEDLPSQFCTVVVGSDDVGLWVGTNRGVAHVDNGRMRVFSSSDGLPSNEVNRGAGLVDAAGRVWLGSIGGVACFGAAEERERLPPPRVHIQGVSVFDRSLGLNSNLELAHDQNFLVFKYVGISLSRGDRVRYRVKLEGLHDQWRDLHGREVQYTSIPPGEYIFQVKACNADGVWSKPASMSFSIIPPLWRRPWFALLVAVLVTLMVASWVMRLKESNARLEARVQQRTAEVRKMYEEIKHLAVTDELTGLRNRRYLELMMPMELKRLNRRRVDLGFDTEDPDDGAEWAGMMLIDLDYFKQVNDSFGHAVGDRVIQEISAVIQDTFRETDIVARIGGEEFLVYLSDLGSNKIGGVAEKLLAAVRSHEVQMEGRNPIRVTCSIGYAMLPTHVDSRKLDWRDLAKVVDAAMYRAKRTGRDKTVGIAINTATAFEDTVSKLDEGLDEAVAAGVCRLLI